MTTVKTYEEAVKRRLDLVKEALASGCLDPELYDVLVELNSAGFFTWQSCAGHTRGNGSHGSITFASPAYKKHSGEVESILWVLSKHGLEGIRLTPGKNNTTATFAPIGSQYTPHDRLLFKDPFDRDEAGQIPPIPDKCPSCDGADFWLNGEFYEVEDTMEWMCKKCQPKPFKKGSYYQTYKIRKRRKELPKLKLWEVEDQETGKTFLVRAKNEKNVYKRLGMSPYDDDCIVFIKRVK